MAHTFPSTQLHLGMCICAHVFSHVWRFVTSWTIACWAPRSMEFSRQEYWSRLPSPNLGDLPNPGIKPTCLGSPALAGRFFTSWAMREAPTSEYQDSKCLAPLHLKLTWYGTSTYFNKNKSMNSLILKNAQHPRILETSYPERAFGLFLLVWGYFFNLYCFSS